MSLEAFVSAFCNGESPGEQFVWGAEDVQSVFSQDEASPVFELDKDSYVLQDRPVQVANNLNRFDLYFAGKQEENSLSEVRSFLGAALRRNMPVNMVSAQNLLTLQTRLIPNGESYKLLPTQLKVAGTALPYKLILSLLVPDSIYKAESSGGYWATLQEKEWAKETAFVSGSSNGELKHNNALGDADLKEFQQRAQILNTLYMYYALPDYRALFDNQGRWPEEVESVGKRIDARYFRGVAQLLGLEVQPASSAELNGCSDFIKGPGGDNKRPYEVGFCFKAPRVKGTPVVGERRVIWTDEFPVSEETSVDEDFLSYDALSTQFPEECSRYLKEWQKKSFFPKLLDYIEDEENMKGLISSVQPLGVDTDKVSSDFAASSAILIAFQQKLQEPEQKIRAKIDGELDKEIEEFEQQIEQYNESVTSAVNEVFESNKTKLDNELSELKEKFSEQVGAVDNSVAELQERQQNLEAALEALKGTGERYDEEKAQQVDEFKEDSDKIKNTIQEVTQKLTEGQQQLNETCNNKLVALQNTLNSFDEGLQSVVATIKGASGGEGTSGGRGVVNENLSSKDEASEADGDKGVSNEFRNEVASIRGHIEDARSKVQEFKQELIDGLIDTLQRDRKEVTDTVREAAEGYAQEIINEGIVEKIAGVTGQIDDLAAKATQLEEQIVPSFGRIKNAIGDSEQGSQGASDGVVAGDDGAGTQERVYTINEQLESLKKQLSSVQKEVKHSVEEPLKNMDLTAQIQEQAKLAVEAKAGDVKKSADEFVEKFYEQVGKQRGESYRETEAKVELFRRIFPAPPHLPQPSKEDGRKYEFAPFEKSKMVSFGWGAGKEAGLNEEEWVAIRDRIYRYYSDEKGDLLASADRVLYCLYMLWSVAFEQKDEESPGMVRKDIASKMLDKVEDFDGEEQQRGRMLVNKLKELSKGEHEQNSVWPPSGSGSS